MILTLPKRARLVVAALLSLPLLSGCAGWTDPISRAIPETVRPYRPDVQQGNWITQSMVEELRVGMSREQVRFVLGSPMLTSVFHADRWDYPFVFRQGRGNDSEVRRFTVFFDADGRLDRWEGDDQPAVQPFQQGPQADAANRGSSQ